MDNKERREVRDIRTRTTAKDVEVIGKFDSQLVGELEGAIDEGVIRVGSKGKWVRAEEVIK